MENEIKVNEFVRTKDGYIGKYVKDGLRKGTIEVEDNMVSWIVDNYNILKCSKNLIDLIQVGDYVNGEKVTEIKEWNSSKDGYFRYAVTCYYEIIRADEIKTVVTKEMMESISYKVKRNSDEN